MLFVYFNNITIGYYITSYSGLFLNLIINKIDNFNVHMSYSLRIRNYNKEINSKKNVFIQISKVNCYEKYDENTIPELDKHILS